MRALCDFAPLRDLADLVATFLVDLLDLLLVDFFVVAISTNSFVVVSGAFMLTATSHGSERRSNPQNLMRKNWTFVRIDFGKRSRKQARLTVIDASFREARRTYSGSQKTRQAEIVGRQAIDAETLDPSRANGLGNRCSGFDWRPGPHS